jgi:hypothetical protein
LVFHQIMKEKQPEKKQGAQYDINQDNGGQNNKK